MVFKKIIIFLLLVVFMLSCKRADDAQHSIFIFNDTNDTLLYKIGWLNDGILFPHKKNVFSRGLNQKCFEYIKDDFNNDSLNIYRSDTLIIKWGGPLRVLPDSIHSFYNENSWNIEYGGRNNKYEIATFTITEDDFKKDD